MQDESELIQDPEATEADDEALVSDETAHTETPALDELVASLAEEEAPLPVEAPESGFEAEVESAQEPEVAVEPESEPATEPEVAVEPEPEPATEPAAPAELESEVDLALELGPSPTRVPWWPFIVLIVLWVAASGASAYLLTRSDVPAYQQEWYPAIVIAGVVLTLLGPVVAGITWGVVRKEAQENERGGLFVRSFFRAAAITLFGVLVWWGTLVAVDALRLGLISI